MNVRNFEVRKPGTIKMIMLISHTNLTQRCLQNLHYFEVLNWSVKRTAISRGPILVLYSKLVNREPHAFHLSLFKSDIILLLTFVSSLFFFSQAVGTCVIDGSVIKKEQVRLVQFSRDNSAYRKTYIISLIVYVSFLF